jgi:nucleoside-diphosphate-sugar epimerase
MTALHVVIGSGMVGTRLAEKLARNKKKVVLVSRNKKSINNSGIAQMMGDATSLQSLLKVADKAKVVYNCVNPPHYNKWDVEWPVMFKNISDYAIKVGADLVTCSNLYGYGPFDGVLTEEIALNASWTNGKVRALMWIDAQHIKDTGQLRVTEVRGSDYICANDQSRMGDRVVPNLIAGKKIQLLGELDQPHTWTDPDDVAELMLTVVENEKSWGRPWHVPSNKPKTQRQVVADIARELKIVDYRLSAFGSGMEKLIGFFNPIVRELNHGSYQFNKPFVMSSQAAQETFGLSPKPWDLVIKDLIKPYLEFVNKNGRSAITKKDR